MEDLWVLFFLHIFEPGIILFLGLSLLNHDFSGQRLVVYSIVMGIVVWSFRGILAKLVFGSHLLPIVVISIILAYVIVRLPIKIAIASVLIGFVFLLGFEILIIPNITAPLMGTLKVQVSKPLMHIIGGWSIDIVLLAVGLVVRWMRKK